MLTNSSILITGGTGSFGHAFVAWTLAKYNSRLLVILSRDGGKLGEGKLKQDAEELQSGQNRIFSLNLRSDIKCLPIHLF